MSNTDILREFVLETHENLALLDDDLLKLEKNPTEKNTLAQVFRTLHSVKGTAGFMGLVKLQAVSHASESLLSRLRAGEMRFSPTIATALLRVVDAIREMLAQIEATGDEGDGNYAALIAEVDRLREAGDQAELSPLPAESTSPLPLTSTLLTPTVALSSPLMPVPGNVVDPVVPTKLTLETTALLQPDTTLDLGISMPPPAAMPVVPPPPQETHPKPKIIPAPTLEPPRAEPAVAPRVAEAISEPPEARPPSTADTSIRVDVHLLDKLMTLMGELVLARNQILQYSTLHEDSDFLGAVQRLNLLTSELQASVMKTRMQPIGNVLSKFPRIVRDLALACGKQVRFEMEGQDTELDKTLLEAIRDPLTHIVRNAVDHGIETPDVRKSRGKPEEGRLRMVAYHEGGKVIVEITDDGGGINVARVREKALQAKLVTPDAASRLSKQELLQLIFLPGFSTAERVTQFSGRGVGMDVVRTNIERIGGSVDLDSSPELGTTIRTKIPLTLAIIPALIVVSGGERYAIPQVSLVELVWLDGDQAKTGVQWLHGVPVYRLRGTLLPLVFLNEQFRLPARTNSDEINIVVLQADECQFGVVVDAIRDTEEIVVKPLQKQLKGVPVFAGAAIMGDGRVALVLDILALAQQANVVSGAKSRVTSEHQPQAAVHEAEPLLLFASSGGGQMAVPLSQVARLEEFPRNRLERLGSQQVVQYRGEILSLVDVAQAIDRLQSSQTQSQSLVAPTAEMIQVVVYTQDNRQVGLLVETILDIVPTPAVSRSSDCRPGVLFTGVVQEKVTEVVDVLALLGSFKP
jgi:two-component system chemotaxis sensor kinase CheA